MTAIGFLMGLTFCLVVFAFFLALAWGLLRRAIIWATGGKWGTQLPKASVVSLSKGAHHRK